MNIKIWTDGSSRGNPGPGGWGCILIVENGKSKVESQIQNIDGEVIELGGREASTTNNRMELKGAIESLRHVTSYWPLDGSDTSSKLVMSTNKLSTVQVSTDSQYVLKGITEWIDGWVKNNWKTSNKKPVLNKDLWESLKLECDRLKKDNVEINWKHVPGHAGVPLNERADTIATSCALEETIKLYRGSAKEYPYF